MDPGFLVILAHSRKWSRREKGSRSRGSGPQTLLEQNGSLLSPTEASPSRRGSYRCGNTFPDGPLSRAQVSRGIPPSGRPLPLPWEGRGGWARLLSPAPRGKSTGPPPLPLTPPSQGFASPAPRPAPPPLHQDLPPWAIPAGLEGDENSRERPPGGTGPVPWRARPRVGQSMASSPGPDWRPGCCRTPPDPVSDGAGDSNANGRNSGDQGPVHRQFPETCPPPIPVASP